MALKMCEFSVATHAKIIFLHNSGLCYREIDKKLNLNFSIVCYLSKGKKDTGSIITKLRTERPRKIDTRQRRAVIKNLRKFYLFFKRSKIGCWRRFNVGNDSYTQKDSSWFKYLRNNLSKKKTIIKETNKVKGLNLQMAFVRKIVEY